MDAVEREAACPSVGEPITVLAVSGKGGYLVPVSEVGTDQLRKAGLNVDLQAVDMGTLIRRRTSNETADKGGWDVFFWINDVLFFDCPATNTAMRGDGKSGMPGWPDSPRLETLRAAWIDAADADTERRIGRELQLQMWQDVPYIPMGHWIRSTAHQRDIVDLPWGFPAFYGVRRA